LTHKRCVQSRRSLLGIPPFPWSPLPWPTQEIFVPAQALSCTFVFRFSALAHSRGFVCFPATRLILPCSDFLLVSVGFALVLCFCSLPPRLFSDALLCRSLHPFFAAAGFGSPFDVGMVFYSCWVVFRGVLPARFAQTVWFRLTLRFFFFFSLRSKWPFNSCRCLFFSPHRNVPKWVPPSRFFNPN